MSQHYPLYFLEKEQKQHQKIEENNIVNTIIIHTVNKSLQS